MRARGYRLGLKALAVAGVLVAGCSLAQAQSDWFRPPADVGQSGARSSQQQRVQSRQQQQRARQQQQTRQQAAQPAPRRSWSPFQPLIDLFGGNSRSAREIDRPTRLRPPPPSGGGGGLAAPAPSVAQQPAEPRGKVFSTAAEARRDVSKAKDVVLVLGDEQAGALAQGLADAFAADRDGAVVVGKTENASGLAPTSGFDWLAAARQLPGGDEQPNVIVALTGSNDFVPIEDLLGRAELLDERWRDLYGRRFDEFLLGLKMHGRPVVVVGLPPVEDDVRSEQIARLNALMKERAERAGLIFVDVTDGFVDENGKFMMSGPAVDGQRRRLRTADGVGFTRAGARKLAFFVDQQLDDLMNREDVPAAAADPADARPSIILLTGGVTGSARALAGAPAMAARPAPGDILQAAPGDTKPEPASVLVSGSALPAVAGRTDDFRWPPGQPAAAVEPLVPPMPETGLPSATPAAAPSEPSTPDAAAGTATPGTATP
ncbi:DUF459 domain-containing protein [Starkeya sp. 3C]|uniref:DUF459 domain-containing protein n=1 Tax=Ancylobacter moscoviensis TaxID=2597768 RepID=A0ABY3DMX4_9HYPH|nr:DUF459 domain-containing protein [Ancylobacter moscoviensis]TSJ60648.1 DUF459 domain-containing protein [Ancylobacter moscoviensis]